MKVPIYDNLYLLIIVRQLTFPYSVASVSKLKRVVDVSEGFWGASFVLFFDLCAVSYKTLCLKTPSTILKPTPSS